MNFLSPNSKAKSMFAKSLEQHILPHDLESFGAMNDLDERDGKRKSPPRENSPNEMMHDKKIKPLSAIPFLDQSQCQNESADPCNDSYMAII